METPYGLMEGICARWEEKEILFIARHGKKHQYPPHRINYRANIYGLFSLGCVRVIAISAVGSLREEMKPGDFVLSDQFLDFTKHRLSTFSEEGQIYHLDVTSPYCPELREILARALEEYGCAYHFRGAYVCTEGPRFETPLEIRFFRSIGGDMVGMTGVPEVVLARELGMCYSQICVVSNWAAGVTPHPLSAREVEELLGEKRALLWKVLQFALTQAFQAPSCSCGKISSLARLSLP